MRILGAVVTLAFCAVGSAERILLVPIDSRPATGQFAQMIAQIAGVKVTMPPYESLGRFTKPGDPERVLRWFESQDYRDVSAVVVSADMIAYGGLIASRRNDTTVAVAVHRLDRLAALRARAPKTKFYVFSSLMRLAPTATKKSKPWRATLARYEALRERATRTANRRALIQAQGLIARIPPTALADYEQARHRDFAVQIGLIDLTARKKFDYTIVGQDDAQPYGPQIAEEAQLRRHVTSLGIDADVYFCEGIDQNSNVLVSRAILREANWTPRIRVVVSDEQRKNVFANYESKRLMDSLADQIFASGARPAEGEDYDYTLYLNVPHPRADQREAFTTALRADLDKGLPVGVADVNLGKDGTADPNLFQALWDSGKMMNLLCYAGWNTAGNSMGTAIPEANLYLLAIRKGVDPVAADLAQRTFLLHRFVNDYAYHKFVRPLAYALLDDVTNSRDEVVGEPLGMVDNFVRRDLKKYLQTYFDDQLMDRTVKLGGTTYKYGGVNNVRVFLPWPRAYEVRLQFDLVLRPQ